MFQQKRLVPYHRCPKHCGIDGGTVGQGAGDGTWRRGCDWCCCVGGSVYGEGEADPLGQRWTGCRTNLRLPGTWEEKHRRIMNLSQISTMKILLLDIFSYTRGNVGLLDGLSVHDFGPDRNISTMKSMKSSADIHAPQRINPTDFDDDPPAGQSIHLFCKISQHLDGLAQHLVQTFLVSRQCVRTTPTFPLAPPWGWHLWFWVKCLNSYWMDCHDILYTHSCVLQDEL